MTYKGTTSYISENISNSRIGRKTIQGKGLLIPMIVVATAQLMLVMDDTISNIALPSIQSELAIPAAYLPWIINAYILCFGALLIFGGKVGDLFVRKYNN